MTLVDTSSFIEAIRFKGDSHVRNRVENLLNEGLAYWCDPIRLELWNSRGGERERRILNDFDKNLPFYPITAEVWSSAKESAISSREAGASFPAMDLLIFACARVNQLDIESADRHFEMLAKLYTK